MPINFTLVHNGFTNDEADTAGDVDAIAVTGWLNFVAQLPEGMPALAPTEGESGTSFWVRTFYGYLDTDGVLKNKPGTDGGTSGVRIWANDPAFNLENLPYLVHAPKDLRANGKIVKFKPFIFNAPAADIEVRFSDIQPVPSATGQGLQRGPRGHTPWFVPVPGTDPQLYQQMDPDGPVGDPIPIEAIVDPEQIVSVVSDVVPGLVAAAIADADTPAEAAAIAVDEALNAVGLVNTQEVLPFGDDEEVRLVSDDLGGSWIGFTANGGIPWRTALLIAKATNRTITSVTDPTPHVPAGYGFLWWQQVSIDGSEIQLWKGEF